MNTNQKKSIIKYSMYDRNNENVAVNFHINSTPWKEKHIHAYYEMQVMLKNDCINEINGERLTFSAGEFQFVRPNDVHLFYKGGQSNHELLNIEIKESYFKSLVELIFPGFMEKINSYVTRVPIIQLKKSTFTNVTRLLAIAQKYVDITNENRQYYSKQIVLALLLDMIDYFFDYKNQKEMEDPVCYRIMLLMQEPENIGLKLNEILKKFPCNAEYALRHFKAEGLGGPNKVFRDIKLEYACGLLRTTDYKILTIAELCGFNHLGYFNRIFREKYGVAPVGYRKNYFRK